MPDPFVIKERDPDIKKRQIKDYSNRQHEGSYFSDSGPLQALKTGLSQKRIGLFFLVLVFGLIILFGKIFYLQILKGNFYRDIAERNRIRLEEIETGRGIIFDRNNQALVKNISSFSLFATPSNLPRGEEKFRLIEKLSQIIDLSQEEINEILESQPDYTYYPILIKENLPYEQVVLLEIEESNLTGIHLENIPSRRYLAGDSFSHLLGYTGQISPEELAIHSDYSLTDQIGKIGIELIYESLLRGQKGKRRIEIDFTGKEEKIVSFQSPVLGKNIVLSIDAGLQKELAQALEDNIRAAGARKGAAVALDPRSGQVLALVSYPFFNNNLFVQEFPKESYQRLINNPDRPLIFRTIAGQYPSGSTIKMIIAAAALEEKIINEKTVINSTGGITVGEKWTFLDWKPGGHGPTNIIKALAQSVNTFFYYIGGGYGKFTGLGITRLNQYFSLFGLGKITGVDLPGEVKGFLPTPEWKEKEKGEVWYIGDTYHVSIGQGDILVTPLQVANFTAAIANGGILYQPSLVKEIKNVESDEILKIKEPVILRKNLINPAYLELVKQGLREAVRTGSARGIDNLSVAVAGKTGTAELEKARPHAWFTCFAPYENPEIVITVVIENGGQGNAVALPVAKEVLGWYFGNH